MGQFNYNDCLTEVEKIASVKSNLKDAIKAKGVSIALQTPFSEYASKISEIPGPKPEESLTQSITSNGTYNYTPSSGYAFSEATLIVDVPSIEPTGTLDITSNGTYDVGSYAFASVNVSGGEVDTRFDDLVARTISGNITTMASNIYYGAFYDCKNITGVEAPNCEIIGDSSFGITVSGAFGYCSNLTSISLPVCSLIGLGTFEYCPKLSSVYAPNLKRLASYAFNNATSFRKSLNSLYYSPDYSWAISQTSVYGTRPSSVVFPSECFLLANDIFYSYQATSLPNYVEGQGVKYIGAGAFQYCTGLSSVSFPNVIEIEYSAFSYCSTLGANTTITFPKCEYVGPGAFRGCNSLGHIELDSCEYIGDYAFIGCSNLSIIDLPACSYIGSYAFSGCSNLYSVSLPACTSIGNSVFQGCTGLSEISLPACTSIGNSVFQGCTGLSEISLPSCTSIGNSAFSGCSNLSSVSLPVCEYIGDSAFRSCTELTSISLPACSRLGGGAFQGCTRLSEAYFMGSSIAGLGGYPFGSTPMADSSYLGYYGSIYVPASLVDQYKVAFQWSTYSDRFVGI